MIEKKEKEKAPAKALVAKKAWRIVQNEIDIKIKEGQEISFGSGKGQVPERFRANLKTEKVI